MTRPLPLATALLFAVFAGLVYSYVVSDGLCCADDSTNAIVAKNLALGYGYTNSISYDGSPGFKTFDPGTTTGPSLNVPAAAFIRVLGNQPWVPGATTATASLGFLLLIWGMLGTTAGANRAAAYTAALLLLLYVATAGISFEHWYGLLGEMPAALCSVLAVSVVARAPDRRRTLALGGLWLGVAMLTKLLALLGAVPVALWLAWRVIASPGARRSRAVDGVLTLTAFALPFALFQTWQVASLGGRAYVASLADFWSYFLLPSSGAVAPTTSPSIWAATLMNVTNHSSVLQTRYGVAPLLLLVILSVVGLLVHIGVRERSLRLYFLFLSGGALLHFGWWVAVSNGLPRYALVGVCLYLAAISCAAFIRPTMLAVAAVVPVLLLAIATSYPKDIQPVRFALRHRFAYTPRVQNLMKVASFLTSLDAPRPFVMGWWATAGDVEYVLPEVGNFIQAGQGTVNRPVGPAILVVNTIWVSWDRTPALAEWETLCSEVLLDAPPYRVSRCPPSP